MLVKSERVRRFLAHYGTLVWPDAPVQLWRAADVIGRLVFLVALAAFGILGVRGDIPVEIVLALVVVFVLVALAVVEFERYEALRAQLDEFRKKEDERFEGLLERYRREQAVEGLLSAIDTAMELQKAIVSDTTDPEGVWVGKVDRFEVETTEMLQKRWPEYLEYYKRDSGLVGTMDGWRNRLATLAHIKALRLIEINRRDMKARYPNLDVEEGPQSSNAAISSQDQT